MDAAHFDGAAPGPTADAGMQPTVTGDIVPSGGRLKRRLFTPGPTQVPPEVLAALAEPLLHHRSPEFRAIFARVVRQLGPLFGTEGEVLLFSGSGTSAMESAVMNLATSADPVVVASHGMFGERWIDICQRHGLDVRAVRAQWGLPPNPAAVGRAVKESGASIVFCQHNDTSTGVLADVRSIKQAVGDTTLVVDAVSTLGAVPVEMDAWGLDVVVSGTQKGLMTPPGLALVAVSRAVWRRLEEPRTFAWDWARAREAQLRGGPLFTPAIPLVRGLDVALELIAEEGLAARFDRHRRLARATRAGVRSLGLDVLAADHCGAIVTAVVTPPGVPADELVFELHNRFGATLALGAGDLKRTVLRIGHVGWCDIFDAVTVVAALETVLARRGVNVGRPGAATAALLAAYAEDP